MVDFDINKVEVFISSMCGGKYTIVREALRALLKETGFCSVYCFEDDYASSKGVKSSFLDELSKSDLAVFLIDNNDGVSNPVQSEIDRAREKNIKCIFLFCSEDKKEPTPLQLDLKNQNKEKYKEVPYFSDLPYVAYKSVIKDIIRIYRSYNPNLDNNTLEKSTVDFFVINSDINSDFYFRKEILNNLAPLYSVIPKSLGVFYNEVEGKDSFSCNMEKLLQYIL